MRKSTTRRSSALNVPNSLLQHLLITESNLEKNRQILSGLSEGMAEFVGLNLERSRKEKGKTEIPIFQFDSGQAIVSVRFKNILNKPVAMVCMEKTAV